MGFGDKAGISSRVTKKGSQPSCPPEMRFQGYSNRPSQVSRCEMRVQDRGPHPSHGAGRVDIGPEILRVDGLQVAGQVLAALAGRAGGGQAIGEREQREGTGKQFEIGHWRYEGEATAGRREVRTFVENWGCGGGWGWG